MSIFGDGLMDQPQHISESNPAQRTNKQKLKENYEQLEYESQFDRETLERLRALQSAKEHAERDEDYGEAKKLKEAIEKLKLVGTQISKLEERKEIAVRNEDYDSAMIIKREIEKLKNAVFAPGDSMPPPGHPHAGQPGMDRGYNQPSQSNYGGSQMGGPPQQQRNYNGSQYDERQQSYNQGGDNRGGGPPQEEYGGAEDRPLPNAKFQHAQGNMGGGFPGGSELENDSSIINKSQQQYGRDDDQDRPPIKQPTGNMQNGGNARANRDELTKPYDDQPIPTMMAGGSGMNDQFREEMEQDGGGRNDEVFDEAEEIGADQIGNAELLMAFLSKGVCKGIFSKNWIFRDKYLKVIGDDLGKGAGSEH